MPFEAGHRFNWSWGRCGTKNSVSEPISGPKFRPNFLQCRRKALWAAPRFPEGLPEAFWKAPKASLNSLQGLFGLTFSLRENLGEPWANFFPNPWPDQKWQARLEPLTAESCSGNLRLITLLCWLIFLSPLTGPGPGMGEDRHHSHSHGAASRHP